MGNSITCFLIALLLFSIPENLLAQNDTAKVVTKAKIFDGEIGVIKSKNQLKATSVNKKTTPNIPFEFKIDKKINPKAINKKLSQNKTNTKNHNFLMETLPEDSDIIGKKYWKGKDVTHKKLKSSISLGTINSTTRTVKIECRDHSYIDGDRIQIYVNEKVVSSNIGLKRNYFVVYIQLEKGYNRIDFQALNQGFSGPNTAEVIVYDAKGNLLSAKEWNLNTGETATLGIIHIK